MKPSTPYSMVTPNTTQADAERGSAHRMVATAIPARIISPPMVGVPFLVRRCDAGPSSRIGCPRPCLARIQLMKREPIETATICAVISASMMRTVR